MTCTITNAVVVSINHSPRVAMKLSGKTIGKTSKISIVCIVDNVNFVLTAWGYTAGVLKRRLYPGGCFNCQVYINSVIDTISDPMTNRIILQADGQPIKVLKYTFTVVEKSFKFIRNMF